MKSPRQTSLSSTMRVLSQQLINSDYAPLANDEETLDGGSEGGAEEGGVEFTVVIGVEGAPKL